MTQLVLRRLGWTALVVWFVVTLTFLVTTAIPADPAQALLGPHATEDGLARVRAHYCLDRGALHQYGCWIANLARGDLGESFRSKRAVTELLSERWWPTAQLAIAAIALQLAVGVPLGIAAAVWRRRWPDHAATAIGLAGQSAPPFVIASTLVYVVAYWWGWLPVSGYGDGGWDRVRHLVLPAVTLATAGVALSSRLMRAELIEVLGSDYVRTARAKGLSERAVLTRHALRNAIGPVVTLVGVDLGALLGGAVVIEVIFAWPGLGRESMQAILELDIPVILGVVMVSAVAIALVNLAADLALLWLDPRLRDGAFDGR